MKYVILMKERIYKLLFLTLLAMLFTFSAIAAPVLQGTPKLHTSEAVHFTLAQQGGSYLIKGDTRGLPQADYALTFAMYGLTRWGGCDAVAFAIENNSNVAVRPELSVRLSPLVVLKAVGPCQWQEENQPPLVVMPQDGGVAVPPGKRGQLIVPFASLQYRGKNYPIDYFTAWTVDFHVPQEAVVDLRLENFFLYPQGSALVKNIAQAPSITGEDSLQAPQRDAESIAQYRLDKNLLGTFQLAAPYEGVSISENGKLRITNQAAAGKVRILALLPNGQQVAKDVFVQADAAAGTVAAEKTADSIANLFFQEDSYRLLRYMLLVLAAVAGIILFYGNRKLRRKAEEVNQQ